MAAVVQVKDISYSDTFDGWADVGVNATLTMSLRDDFSAIDCYVQINENWARKGSRTDVGDGYVNMIAYAWANGSSGAYEDPDAYPETWSGAKSQFSDHFPQFFDNLIWVGYADDRGVYSGTEVPTEEMKHRVIYITDDMWDEDHNLKDFPIVYVGDRWYGATDDHLLHNRVRPLDGFSATDFDWSYFPWAKMSGGKWLSCNRDGGAKQAVSGGGWTDKKNDLYHKDRNTGHYYGSGDWQRSPLVGEE